MEDQPEIEKLQQAISALEAQRQVLGDQVVETALAPLRERLVALRSGGLGEARKLVTVLFADLTGFTALSARLDPEEMRELLTAYFSSWRKIIERYGGVVEKFIGDAVMAVFGLPVSHEDDPERAIRAALDMRQALEQLNLEKEPQTGIRLAMRVGINTGEGLVSTLGERLGEEFVVVGEIVNLASRLQTAAPEGGILITSDTYRHVQGLFDVQPFERLQLKGISDPVQAFLVKAVKPRLFQVVQRGIEGIETVLVGREGEVKGLQDAFFESAQEKRLQVITLVGEAGIGKTRLISEFEDWLERLPQRVYYFQGRAHPSAQNVPYSLLRDLFAVRFEIQDSDPADIVRQKLERGYRQAFPDELVGTEGLDAILRGAHFVGRLLGFEFGASGYLPASGQDARSFHDQALVHLGDFFRALAQLEPVVVLLEDIHWADDSSLDLVHYLESTLARQPLLVVGTARPALYERRPHWGEGLPSHTRLKLQPLSTRDSRFLVNQILRKVHDLPESLRELVISTAEGNPFYIEELLKMLIEDEVILPGEPTWQVQIDRLAGLRVPPTLVGVLQARFDSLAPQQRTFLQCGSVLGRTFWDRAVEFLASYPGDEVPSEQPSATIFQELRAREMIFQRERSTFQDTVEYFFKHALLRDVTYESLLKRQRRAYHARAAHWLETISERVQRSDEFAALIADHYEQADETGLAAEWFRHAGRSAAARYAPAEAVHAFSRALELSPLEDDRQFEIRLAREKMYELQGNSERRAEDLLSLRLLAERSGDPVRLAQVAMRQAAYEFSRSNYPGVLAAAQEAILLGEQCEAKDVAAEAYLLEASALMRQGELQSARDVAQHALSLARQDNLPAILAGSLRALGVVAYYHGNPQEARDYFEKALELYIQVGDRQGEGMVINNLGGATFDLGDYTQAGVFYTRSLELSRQIGDRQGEARALNNLGIIAIVKNAYQQAEGYYLQALQICRDIGNRSSEISALDNLGNLAQYRYQYSRSIQYHEEALSIARSIGDQTSETLILANLGRGYQMAGDIENARRYIQESLNLSKKYSNHKGDCESLISLGLCHLETGDVEAARDCAQQALDLSLKYELRSEQGWAYAGLADVLVVSGELEQAIQFYGKALEIRDELGESSEAIDTRTRLAEALVVHGDREKAITHVEFVLKHLQEHGSYGLDRPILILLGCYRVLVALGDSRALAVLEQGHSLLQDCAANIEDENLRETFLENVRVNRELQSAWAASR